MTALSPYEAWFLDARDIWGFDRPELASSTPVPTIPKGAEGARLAYDVAWQLHSRITTQKLGFRAGDEATALKSVYDLFAFARAHVEDAGVLAGATADLVWWMLNRDVRPFTARWHRVSSKGLLSVGDVARRFRAELEHLRLALVEWAALFRQLAAGATPRGENHALPNKDFRRHDFPDPRAMGHSPCARDGMAVPSAFLKAYEAQVAAERPFLKRWRQVTGRSDQAPLSGIALSGGGIRSAVFALGILRQLALRLPIFAVDYLSTVSGGGYLGSLVTAAYEHAIVASDPTRGPLGRDEYDDVGAAVIGWLRGRGTAMKVDVPLVASLSGTLLAEHGVADEYELRLRETWLLGSTIVPGFGRVVGAASKDVSFRIADLASDGPLQLWNMAINATNLGPGMLTALRSRQADLYTVSRAGTECRILGRGAPGDWTIERAMALSGAAAAPTTAEDTPRWILRLVAAFGVNLGRWIDHETGNARAASWWEHAKSLLGTVEERDGTAFISDGGHVENSALYPLLRRRCAVILAIDGEQDPEMTFAGLTKLQHLVRVEQGIELEIDLSDLALNAQGHSDAHFTVIRVHYPKVGDVPAQEGIIVHAKLSLTGDEPQYLRAFKQSHPPFPHDTTLDQSYDDRMFEAYLALGEHVGTQLVAPEWVGDLSENASVESWILALARRFVER